MGYFLDTLRALGTTLRNALRPPTTVEYPEVERPRGERLRTSFALLHDEHGEELCIGCLMCERICPSRVIVIRQGPKSESKVTGKKRGWAEDVTLDLNACIYCELCVQVCPQDALVMTKVPEAPVFERESLVLTMDALYANEHGKPRSWGTGSRLMGMQEPPAEAKPAAKTKAENGKPAAKPSPTREPARPSESAPATVATEGT